MVKQIERGDFEELLLSSADDTMDNWACSTCKKDNEKTAVHCAACSACRLHGEMDCKPCKDKKPPTAPAKAPAKGAAAKAPAKSPAKAAAT
jgi:predicted amidophosphoribosyltransferase